MLTFRDKNGIFLHFSGKIATLESSGAKISCSDACSSSSRACNSSSGQRLQSLEAPEALFFSRGLAFSPSGATTLPHINYACTGARGVCPDSRDHTTFACLSGFLVGPIKSQIHTTQSFNFKIEKNHRFMGNMWTGDIARSAEHEPQNMRLCEHLGGLHCDPQLRRFLWL